MVKKNVVALVALVILLTATVVSEAQVLPGLGFGSGNWGVIATPAAPPVFTRTWGSRNSSTVLQRIQSQRWTARGTSYTIL